MNKYGDGSFVSYEIAMGEWASSYTGYDLGYLECLCFDS